MVLLGIDPGSRVTGYGIIKTNGCIHSYIASGCIISKAMDFNSRLINIFKGISSVIKSYNPVSVAVEQVFIAHNPSSALKLGQARGAAIAAIANHDINIQDYSARQVKQAITGYGNAEKKQVQYMVKMLLKLSAVPQEDAADALAIAICHGNSLLRQQKY
jgi:crossover junction endodeoxyribonuclease RuvC